MSFFSFTPILIFPFSCFYEQIFQVILPTCFVYFLSPIKKYLYVGREFLLLVGSCVHLAFVVVIFLKQSLHTNESEREMPLVDLNQITCVKLQSRVQIVLAFYILKPQVGMGKKARLGRSLHGSQKVSEGNGQLFQIFLLVFFFQVASEVMLDQETMQTVL